MNCFGNHGVQKMKVTTFRISTCAVLLCCACLSFGQQETASQTQSEAKPSPRAASLKRSPVKPPADAKPKLTEEQKAALQILETAEGSARGFEAPMRSYSLFQIASSLTNTDQKKARSIFNDAFTASLEVRDDDDTKERLQQEVLRTLLPLSIADVEQALPQAEPKVRKEVSQGIISAYTGKKEYGKAIDLIYQLTGWDEFPYGSATTLMDAMPSEMSSEKNSLFFLAVNSYKNHKHEGLIIGNQSFTEMVVHFGGSMNPKLTLEAIDEILSQAKAADKDKSSITIGGDGGSASFTSNYDYQLFAVLPLLRQLDESKAKALLEENQDIQGQVEKYPNGLDSVSPPKKDDNGGKPLMTQRRNMGVDVSSNAAAEENARMMQQQQLQLRIKNIIDEASKDPTQAIADTTMLPASSPQHWRPAPRAQALEGIARANVKTNPGAASRALAELRKVSSDLPLRQQVQQLAGAAELYMQMDDKDNAEKMIADGVKAADKLLENDTNPDNPNKALKAWWPSADAYRRFVEIQAKISRDDTLALIKEIKDPEIRTMEQIMVARTLMGLPMKRFIVVEKTKGNNSFSTFENN